MIDRFWLIDATNFITAPASTMTFGYDPNEMPTPNTITSRNLVATTYNTGTDEWGGTLLNYGTDNTSINSVVSAIIPSTQHFTSWTLVDVATPLPVSLIYFNALCETNFVELNWATASESNSSHFDIEKSTDGVNWSVIHQTPAQGNSSQIVNYTYRDYNPESQVSYYRLHQYDLNYISRLYDIQSVQACGESENNISVINQLNAQYQINILEDKDDEYEVNLHDLSGKRVRSTKSIHAVSGNNVFIFNDDQLSTGIYMLTVSNPTTIFTYKLLIQK
jgi:hypothetical protein